MKKAMIYKFDCSCVLCMFLTKLKLMTSLFCKGIFLLIYA